jgi:sugar-specific transcriptional regulator TrmB
MDSIKSLEKLGLNDKEQKIYLALLQLERATANRIAREARIKRPTTYDILYRLQSQGFIYETEENKKRYFIANPPEKLIDIVEDQKRELLRDLPLLTSIFNTNPKKPKVAYFEGYEGIKQLYENTLKSLKKGDEILAYVTNETVKYLEDYSVDYVKRRVAKGIKFRGIYQDEPELNQYLKHDKEQLRISKTVKSKDFPIKNEINIYANKMIIITYSPGPYGILIESNEVVETHRSIFEMAWRGIK